MLKVWRFYWPPRVKVEWVFEDPSSADRTFKAFKKVLGKTSKKSRKVEDKTLPAVAIDWRDWRRVMIASQGRPSIIDMIVEKYLGEKSRRRHSESLQKT